MFHGKSTNFLPVHGSGRLAHVSTRRAAGGRARRLGAAAAANSAGCHAQGRRDPKGETYTHIYNKHMIYIFLMIVNILFLLYEYIYIYTLCMVDYASDYS